MPVIALIISVMALVASLAALLTAATISRDAEITAQAECRKQAALISLLQQSFNELKATNGTEPTWAGTHATVVLGSQSPDTKGEKGE